MSRSMQRFLWGLWILCLLSPFVFVGSDYDPQRGGLISTFRKDRLEFFANEFPRWFTGHAWGLLGIAGIIIALVLLAKWIRTSEWTARQALFVTERKRALAGISIGTLILLPGFLNDKYLGLAIFTGIYILLAMGLNQPSA